MSSANVQPFDNSKPLNLDNLPVELMYELQLFALSEALPFVNRRTKQIFQAAPVTYRARYIFGRYFQAFNALPPKNTGFLVSYALRFGLCTKEILEFLLARAGDNDIRDHIEKFPRLPRRLFSSLAQRSKGESPWSSTDEPLPFLRFLNSVPQFSIVDFNVYGGYPLSRAVHAGHIPLITFLLSKGARPDEKDALAVRIAVRKRDLALVELLIESSEDAESPFKSGKRKRRRLEDRMQVTTALLRLAVEVDARDIVGYFMYKGARPDMKTIDAMIKRGIA